MQGQKKTIRLNIHFPSSLPRLLPSLAPIGPCFSTGVGKPAARKGQDSKHFRLRRAEGLSCNYLALHLKLVSSQRQCVSEWVWQRSNKTLFMGIEIWISYHFHVSQNILLILPNYLNMKKPGRKKRVNENSRQDVFGFAGHGLQLSASTPPGCIDSESLSWHRGQKTTVKLLNSLWPQPDTMYEEEFSFSLQMLPHLKPGVSLWQQKKPFHQLTDCAGVLRCPRHQIGLWPQDSQSAMPICFGHLKKAASACLCG